MQMRMIKVKFHNNRIGLIKPAALDEMIESKKIQAFQRATGWVVPGKDKIRQHAEMYYGAERREFSYPAAAKPTYEELEQRVKELEQVLFNRKQAEMILRDREAEIEDLSVEDIQLLIYELEVRQVEMEMQNFELRRTQEQLLESRKTLIDLYENAPIGYLSFDTQGLILGINSTGAHQLGFEKDFLINQPNTKICAPDDLDTFHLHLRKVFETKTIQNCELKLVKRNGTKFFARLESIAVQDNEGYFSRCRTAFSDITKRKQAEIEKNRLETQLRQMQKMESLGTLAGGIAHDFNNILTAILGYAEIAKRDLPETSHVFENIMEVLKAGNRAKDLVKQILAFSRQTEQERQPVDISTIAKEALRLLRATIPATIEIKQQIDRDCGMTLADPTQIFQIFMNLCTNAYQAMKDSGGELRVNLANVEIGPASGRQQDLEPGTYIRLVIQDTGPGMDRKTVERIFEPYFTTKEADEGTGLGLSVVHGIVKSHGGNITVHSEPGRGSSFAVLLPRFEPSISAAEAPHAEPLPVGDERILLVDDEEQLVPMIQVMLESLGYRVKSFTSSMQALLVFRNQPESFDLVLTDMTMPRMTGAQLAEKIMRINPKTPVILFTGFSETIDRHKAKELGIREYVMKPVVKADLARIIRKVLDEEERPQL